MADETLGTPFNAYWRPALGFISAAGLFLAFVGFPITEAILTILGHPAKMPTIDVSSLIGMVTTAVGLGGLRTVEKIWNVQANH